MEKEKLGLFVSQLRKEQNMTQKDLAEKLGVTDKAVSKWERGLSFPDISLLEPLADTFEVSVMELLQGKRLPQKTAMSDEPANEVLDNLLRISDQEIRKKHVISKSIIILCCVSLMLLISIILNIINLSSSSGQTPDLSHSAYETTLSESNEEIFANPEKALEQMIIDERLHLKCAVLIFICEPLCFQSPADFPDEWQHLIETLKNTYEEVTVQ